VDRWGIRMILHVSGLRSLSPATFVLRFDRGGISFRPGQYLRLGLPERIDRREYSIYSAVGDAYLEVLVREVEGGLVSGQLRRLRPGDELAVEGPFGTFTRPNDASVQGRYLLVATGTGISPFHSFALSDSTLDYLLLHGVRASSEFYEHSSFDSRRLVRCVTRERGGDFAGRVTDYLRSHPQGSDALCYLCGNCDMIYEAFAILRDQGFAPERIYTEVYF